MAMGQGMPNVCAACRYKRSPGSSVSAVNGLDRMIAQRPTYLHETRPASVWQAQEQAHRARLEPVLTPYLAQRSRGIKDPVMDFLFEYYAFRPSHLLRWSPGLGVALQGEAAEAFLEHPGFAHTPAGVALDPARFPDRRKPALRWVRDLLAATEARPPLLGCHGMHEWAMVYRADTVRHAQVPLRMSPEALAAFVEATPVVCTHYDAFRFFTSAARPLNRHQPTHETMPRLEQPGCLHANMDVYRWTYKLYPWAPADLLADAFDLARRIRAVDMRASPYDLRAFGLDPIPIETPKGRAAYRAHQQRFMREAAPLRARLRHVYETLISYVGEAP